MKFDSLKTSLFLVCTLVFTAICLFLLFYKNVTGLLTSWGEQRALVIYLNVDTLPGEKENLLSELQKHPAVQTANLIDRNQAAQIFKSSLKEFSSGLITNDEMLDLVPETIEVNLKAEAPWAEREVQLRELKQTYLQHRSVDDITDSLSSLQKFKRVERYFKSTGLLILFSALVVLSLLVALMLRVYIDDSRAEIEVYSLLGATRWSIYKVYLKELLAFLSLSLLLSYAVLLGVFIYVRKLIQQSDFSSALSSNLSFFNLEELTLLSLTFFIFIFVASFFSVQKTVNRINQLLHE